MIKYFELRTLSSVVSHDSSSEMVHFCRHCNAELVHEVIDLGHQPPSNAYLKQEELALPELTYPLKVYICTHCWLMQVPAHAKAEELFTDDYAYFSGTSSSWCQHAFDFVQEAVRRLELNQNSFVLELASNDGYLLQYVKSKQIPCLGIEPTRATADAAISLGIETLVEFFNSQLAEKLPQADLIIANNVLAHVPDINDFMSGIQKVLKQNGLVSIEFPHLLNLLKGNQFDTIYHEHFSYLSLHSVQRIAESVGLIVVDVQQLPTHGGSLRVWLGHPECSFSTTDAVDQLLAEEREQGLESLAAYEKFENSALQAKLELYQFLSKSKLAGETVLGYGAAAKGNTLLNYCGIKPDLLPFIVDRALSKQSKFMPGSHIPILSPEKIEEIKPDKILVLPWNLLDEIAKLLPGYNLYTAIPSLKKRS